MADSLSERELISRIRSQAARPDHGLIKGIGDDCAVFQAAGNLQTLVTTDALIEKVHFDTSWHPAFLLGRKAASVNISDIAAMGGRPRYALLAMGVPATVESAWLDRFLDGFLSALDQYQTVLIGGDTVRSPGSIVCSVTVIGEGQPGRILYRHGARIGDLVFVSGPLGEAAAGLAICRAHDRASQEKWPDLVKAHLDPTAEVDLGLLLAESGLVHAMQDLSDGLATDLAHLCAESRVGAQVLADRIPLSNQLLAAAAELAVAPLDWALRGGEDYHLLCTAAPEHGEQLASLARARTGRPLICVGRIVEGGGLTLVAAEERRDIAFLGFDHFS